MIHRLALVNQVMRLYKSLNLVILNVGLHEWFTNNILLLNIDKTKVLPYIM